MSNACEQLDPNSTFINSTQCLSSSKAHDQLSTPIALLYPPVIERGVVGDMNNSLLSNHKADDFIRNAAPYSALLIFAKYAGIANDIDILDHQYKMDEENIPFGQLHDAYGTCLERIGSFMNEAMIEICEKAPSYAGFVLDTDVNKESGQVALRMQGDPFPCVLPLSGDDLLDQMVNSVLVLLSPHACFVLPQNLLEYCSWFEESGEALTQLFTLLDTKDLASIAKQVMATPERFHHIAGDLMMDYSTERDFLEHLEFIDERYEAIPDFLSDSHRLNKSAILAQLLTWVSTNDPRVDDPRFEFLNKGLKVLNGINKRLEQSRAKDYNSVYLSSDDFDDESQPIDLTMFVSYGLEFEDFLTAEIDEQRMQMGEGLTAYLSLSPIANNELRDTLLNIAQAHGVIHLLQLRLADDSNKQTKKQERKCLTIAPHIS